MMASESSTAKTETMLMSGVPVDFPYQPYPCQIAMLGKIIKSLQQSKNCLLESPTGTGKTLTLLCATLAWQQKEIESSLLLQEPLNENKTNPKETVAKGIQVSQIYYCTRTHKQLEQVAKQLKNTVYKDKIRMTLLSSRDNYCIHPTVSNSGNKNHECSKLTRPDPNNREGQQRKTSKGQCGFFERLRGKQAIDFLKTNGSKQIPRIFDIEQFTEYCHTTHAVCPYYTSRLLINDVNIILCPYNYLIDPRVRNSMQLSVKHAVIIIDEAHNIEDCARDSMKFELRKYDFESAINELTVNESTLKLAHIQATHLLTNDSGFTTVEDGSSSTQLSDSQKKLKRYAAGYSLIDQSDEEGDLLDHLNIEENGLVLPNETEQANPNGEASASEVQELANALKFLAERFSRAVTWFNTKDPRDNHVITPRELVEQFHQARFIDRSITTIHKPATPSKPATSRAVIQDAARIRKALNKCFVLAGDYLRLSDEVTGFLEHLDHCLSIIYFDGYKFIDDYKITLKTVPFEPSASLLAEMQNTAIRSTESDTSEWIDMSQKSTQSQRPHYRAARTDFPLHTQVLAFHCLSPSVAFAKDLQLARTFIFASGTLAPLSTYAGELRIPFDFQMECNHVIDSRRTFITALSHGRNRDIRLRATYQNVERTDFQDECGRIVLDVCQRVPYGVLCFLPSYRFLTIIINRWMSSGLWKAILEHKSIFFEEKNGSNFQNTINRFMEANGTEIIKKPKSLVSKSINEMWKRSRNRKRDQHKKTQTVNSVSEYFPSKGGLLLAVCRGRASEGIDFSDNNARCVITIGIPYPNVKEDEVVFKRDYNDGQNRKNSQVMNGSDWYDAQAYRALNQALGRCIRHKNDWGALIIIDERIAQAINEKHFGNKISLWIKQRLFTTVNYEKTMNALGEFAMEMKKLDDLAAESLKNAAKIEEIEREEKTKLPFKKLESPKSTLGDRFGTNTQFESKSVLQGNESPCETKIESKLVAITPSKDEKYTVSASTDVKICRWKPGSIAFDDDDDDDEENKEPEISSSGKRRHAFEKFLVQRTGKIKIKPETTIKTQASSSPDIIDLVSDDEETSPTVSSLSQQPNKKVKIQ